MVPLSLLGATVEPDIGRGAFGLFGTRTMIGVHLSPSPMTYSGSLSDEERPCSARTMKLRKPGGVTGSLMSSTLWKIKHGNTPNVRDKTT